MIRRRRVSNIYFGWWTALTAGLLNLWGFGFQAYGFSALFKPIAAELGIGRAVTSVAASIGRFEGGFEAPLSGWITDRWGPRWIVLFGVFFIGLGLMLMKFINSVWSFYIVWGLIVGTGVNSALAIPLDVAIANWFVKKRGAALSIKWLFSGLSGVLVLPLVAWLISTVGWRTTCFMGGIVMWVVGLPLVWFFVKQRRPEYYGLLPDGASLKEEGPDPVQMVERGVQYAAEAQEMEFTLKQAIRTSAYWLMIMGFAAQNLVVGFITVHLIPFLTDFGIDPLKAAGMMSIWVGASIPGRLMGGLFSDRVPKNYLRFFVGGINLMRALAFTIFLGYQTISVVYVLLILDGLGHGSGLPLNSLMRARYFGRKSLGSIQGTSQLIMTPISVIAPVYAGWIYDTTGSYITAFVIFTVVLFASVAIFAFARPPKLPAHVPEVSEKYSLG
ncbi:MAG: MFS transporter [Chloroflexi bacterium]|nr:MFS transporter [Chloroflexota bacterium]